MLYTVSEKKVKANGDVEVYVLGVWSENPREFSLLVVDKAEFDAYKVGSSFEIAFIPGSLVPDGEKA